MAAPQEQNFSEVTIRNTGWEYLSKYLGKFLSFISFSILAWLLTKDDFGLAGYAAIVINFLDVLSDLGIGAAIIYYKENPKANDTAFWSSIFIGGVLFLLTWIISPYVGEYFNDPRVVPITRTLALTFPLTSVGNVHKSLIIKEINFKKKFVPEFFQSMSKGIISIILALMNFGAWSIVLGQVIGEFISSIVYWIVFPWRPKFVFSYRLLRDLLNYGLGTIGVNAIGIALLNVDYLIVGRVLGTEALGVYTFAFRVPELLIKQMNGVISRVLFPVFSKIKDDADSLKNAFFETLKYVSIISVALGVGLAVVTEPLVIAFFSSKWIEAVPVIRLISIYSVVLSFFFSLGDFYKATGQLRLLSYLSLFRLVMVAPALYWIAQTYRSIVYIGWTLLIIIIVHWLFNYFIFAKQLKVSVLKLFGVLRIPIISGTLMGICVHFLLTTILDETNVWIQMLFGIPLGIFVFVTSLWIQDKNILSDIFRLSKKFDFIRKKD